MLEPRTAAHVHDQLRAQTPLVQVITNYVSMDIAANLLLTLLDRVGVHRESLGDSTGRLPLEPLTVA